MWIKSVSVYNHKSIKDSGLVRLEKDITCFVGMTGTGKTSFLEGINFLDPKVTPRESEITRGSEISQRIANNSIATASVKILETKIGIDEDDRNNLKNLVDENINEITLNRYLDGHYTIFIEDKEIKTPSFDKTGMFKAIEELRGNFRNALNRNFNNVRVHEGSFNNAIDVFKKANFEDKKEAEIAIQSLRNSLAPIPKDPQFQGEHDQRLREIEEKIKEEHTKLNNSDFNMILNSLPMIYFMDQVFKIEDKMPIEQYIGNPDSSQTFSSIAIITQDLLPSGVQSVRTKDLQMRDSYYDTISRKITAELNKIFNQEKYEFKVASDNANLTFSVKDLETGALVSVSEGSEGFKWLLAFYMEIILKMAKSSKRIIILLDNPATSLHDRGKGDVLRLLKQISGSEKLQLIYTTHERALIDPWRPEVIRLVEKKSGEGTKISSLSAPPSDRGVLARIREYIGSPARYSLYGAYRTILFEGITDMSIFLAFNEYLERTSQKNLSKDIYSIDEIGGISNVLDYLRFYKKAGIDFLIIVDSAKDTDHDILSKIEEDDKRKYILQVKEIIDKDGDTEDLIDPKLYLKAFEMATDSQINYEEALTNKGEKKNVNWLKEISKDKKLEYNKSIVAKQFWNMLNNDTSNLINDDYMDAIESSLKRMIKLIERINNKFDNR